MRKKEQSPKKPELQIDADGLKARQSVRATFKLSEQAINLLKVSARHLGINQKTLLDQLIADGQDLGLLVDDVKAYSRNEKECRPKTLVLSRKALSLIEDFSNANHIPRDYAVELSISRLASYVDSLAEKHAKRRRLLRELERCRMLLEDLSGKASGTLEKGDAFLVRLEQLTEKMEGHVDDIRKTVKAKGEFIY